MEIVPHRRNPPKNSMFAGLAATVKGKATSMQEDAKGKVGGRYLYLLYAMCYMEKRYSGIVVAIVARSCHRCPRHPISILSYFISGYSKGLED